ncbi:hypothetical protein WN51_06128 [Melipona quadrifasciata]|uniref:Uncharacterized protein n=1 Tax=Melipona quadrifasciata TaxID=166423 RepID=A0A0N0BBY7_9HYME|nr:hypothetical protein WN51_06128 [Melipona quadrifasciata]
MVREPVISARAQDSNRACKLANRPAKFTLLLILGLLTPIILVNFCCCFRGFFKSLNVVNL